MLINNHRVSIDLFSVLKCAKIEAKGLNSLISLGIPQKTSLQLLSESSLSLHMYQNKLQHLKTTLKTGRIYINDLEKDEKYSNFSENVEEFLFSRSPEILPIAVNFFNIILICDTSDKSCFTSLNRLLDLENKYPLHIGLIFTGNYEIVTLLIEGVKYLRREKPAKTLEFLRKLEFGMETSEILKVFTSFCGENCDLELEYSSSASRCIEFCESSGICGPAQYLLNGRLLDFEGSEGLDDKLYYELMNERRLILTLAMRGYLQPPVDSFFERVPYLNTTERVNLEISSLATNDIKISPSLPNVYFEFPLKNHSPLGFFYIISQIDDINLVKLVIDMADRYSHLPLAIRFLFDFEELTENWKEVLCQILQKEDCSDVYLQTRLHESYSEIHARNLCTSCVIVNGRVIEKVHFRNHRDFLIAYETETTRLGANNIASILSNSEILEKVLFRLLSHSKTYKIFSTYQSAPIPDYWQVPSLSRNYFASSPSFNVQVIVNVESKEAVSLLSLAAWLHRLGGDLTVTYMTGGVDAKFPMYRYYKYLIKHDFEENLIIDFNQTWTYSVNLDVHQAWLVRPLKTHLDLDNLLINSHENVKFLLQNLIIQGQCAQYYRGFDVEPPNGLQLTLSQQKTILSDTIVMKNFGYFQFHTDPGTFHIGLAQGRSQDLFEILEGGEISVKDIDGTSVNILTEKKKGLEDEELLNTGEIREIGDTIHVFSLASGKLYERLIKIMINSVLKFTKSKVKFWLLEDFFSANFKEDLEKLGKALGFEFELLSYKWPSWLYGQSEKQRIIWGYKILFLDVLFPLSVNKVIYIDADQIVRSDIKELWDLDLKGAPYAYTPFCDSNPDTKDFMFWKGGYWKDHLQGLPYHISALYVVDLVRFRNLGAGDILRYFYETLAPNPDSLSNLDQDLPNFAQHQLPIYSLPQEWLWCASWCSEESKNTAKSIDLCNNPLTREHKIQAAKRLIPEWTIYDLEIRQLETELR